MESKFPKKILDIGTGTGLLSLMIAQKSKASIHAIDINENAVGQAKENFKSSPWHSQLYAYCGDVRNQLAAPKYDCIISNPPFYENDLLPLEEEKKNSKHSNSLRLDELIGAVEKLLDSSGFFGVLLPYSRGDYFEKEAKKYALFVNEKLHVKQSVKHEYFRTILILERTQRSPMCKVNSPSGTVILITPQDLSH